MFNIVTAARLQSFQKGVALSLTAENPTIRH
jgi:hypothetical protein